MLSFFLINTPTLSRRIFFYTFHASHVVAAHPCGSFRNLLRERRQRNFAGVLARDYPYRLFKSCRRHIIPPSRCANRVRRGGVGVFRFPFALLGLLVFLQRLCRAIQRATQPRNILRRAFKFFKFRAKLFCKVKFPRSPSISRPYSCPATCSSIRSPLSTWKVT